MSPQACLESSTMELKKSLSVRPDEASAVFREDTFHPAILPPKKSRDHSHFLAISRKNARFITDFYYTITAMKPIDMYGPL